VTERSKGAVLRVCFSIWKSKSQGKKFSAALLPCSFAAISQGPERQNHFFGQNHSADGSAANDSIVSSAPSRLPVFPAKKENPSTDFSDYTDFQSVKAA
jgi:hypothetical protein